MINVTNGLVFIFSGEALSSAVKEALKKASCAILRVHKLEAINLSTVTTKTYIKAAFPKFIEQCTLISSDTRFDEAYVQNAYNIYRISFGTMTPEQFYAFTLVEEVGPYEFKKSYGNFIRTGIGIFLVALHSLGAITLPHIFKWPSLKNSDSTRAEVGKFVSSELLHLIRSLDSQNEEIQNPAFALVTTTKKRREWFLSSGTKLLLMTGWHTPSDVCLKDLLKIKESELQMRTETSMGSVYKALIDVFERRYGAEIAISVEQWGEALRASVLLEDLRSPRGRKVGQYNVESATSFGRSDGDVIEDVVTMNPSLAYPKTLRRSKALQGLELDFPKLASSWLDLEELYIDKVKRESYKSIFAAFGYLNIYLFFYLPYWFHRNSSTNLQFPDVPEKLIAGVFVSKLLKVDVEVPLTFIQVMNKISFRRKWKNTSYYSTLKQVEGFFAFIERHSNELPGCTGFRQPLTEYDYPPVSQRLGTNKRPIPRRLFGLFLDYFEALLEHLNVVQSLIVGGIIRNEDIDAYAGRGNNIIDTFAMSAVTNFVPVIFFKGRTVPLRYIPNVLAIDWYQLKDGRLVKLPQPHSLVQIIAALYTGLRHNHIQWLDARKFDSLVKEDEVEFSVLHVNTDKTKMRAWEPHVNMRVIEVLRVQRTWRELIDSPGFQVQHYYNNNDSSKWEKIVPLFSTGNGGLPHPDSRYVAAWKDVLCSINGLLPEIGENGLSQLCTLEPPNIGFNDINAKEKKKAYGDSCERVCKIDVKSDITPHSCRVTVASQYSTILPADVIGRDITGQSPGTVNYYYVLDEEQLKLENTHQAMTMRERAYRNEFEEFSLSGVGNNHGFIHADRVNSNLAKSLRVNLSETLASYGCISIIMNDDSTSGLDVLRETRGANASENKTEICPYGNHCPQEVIKRWRGTNRCGLCEYAVRSIDHLQAVAARVKQFTEMLDDLTEKIEWAIKDSKSQYSEAELERLDEERSRIAEELAGWRLNEEILYAARNRISKGQDSNEWIVQKPEIILKDLQRINAPSNMTLYTIERIKELCESPMFSTPRVMAQIERLRVTLLAHTGRLSEYFSTSAPTNPAAECAGLLRTIVAANKLSLDDLIALVEGNSHLDGLPASPMRLLENGDLYD